MMFNSKVDAVFSFNSNIDRWNLSLNKYIAQGGNISQTDLTQIMKIVTEIATYLRWNAGIYIPKYYRLRTSIIRGLGYKKDSTPMNVLAELEHRFTIYSTPFATAIKQMNNSAHGPLARLTALKKTMAPSP
jgi:hypothetical protein